MFEICELGYRKALEFLIKDYCIKENKEKEIKKDTLSNVINKYVKNDEIVNMAKRATWLGNDEAHYIRLWEDKDLNDLKKLIEITCYWITFKEATEDYKRKMPKGKK